MSHEDNTKRSKAPVTVRPFQIRGRFLTAIALRPENDTPDEAFYKALDEQLNKTPQFFAGAPLVLDFEKTPGMVDTDRIKDLVENLRRRKLLVFGAQNASTEQEKAAETLGLIPIRTGHDAPMPAAKPAEAAKDGAPRGPQNKVITAPVRSGQTVVAEHGDLTIIGSVASGAELVAGGNIHVYGPLRGRAMAGAHGDETARIFAQHMDAELLAIAGLYKTSETIDDAMRTRNVQIFLDEDRLCMEALG